MVGETLLGRESGHSDVNAGFGRVAVRIGRANLAEAGDGVVQQNHIDVVVQCRISTRAESPKSVAFHWRGRALRGAPVA